MRRDGGARTMGGAGRSRVAWLMLAAWVALVWGHSLVPGPVSSDESGLVVALLRPLFEAAGVADVDTMTLVVRKAAHATEYAILAVLAVRALAPAWPRRTSAGTGFVYGPVGACAVCAAVSLVDELLIQRLTPQRGPSLRDVAIDLAGCVCALLLVGIVARVRGWRGRAA